MGWTLKQAKEHGVGHLHPAMNRGRSVERELLDRLEAAGKPPTEAPDDGMTKLERSFADMLGRSGEGTTWWREPMKLRLAGNTFYTPDFFVADLYFGRPARLDYAFVEVKGFMRDDSAVKLKVAASMYPVFRWLLVVRDGRHGWSVREVGRNGIGREPIIVPWINGTS